MNRWFRLNIWLWASAVAVAMLRQPFAHAERSDDDSDHEHRRPVYQRRAFDWRPKHGHWYGHGQGHDARWNAPQSSAGWFQRPYPYHLDYYKMRYGGSYAPYFGNLYGPPQVVTAPPYYGPYYGGQEFGYPSEGAIYGQVPSESNGVMLQAPVEKIAPPDESVPNSSGDNLPAP